MKTPPTTTSSTSTSGRPFFQYFVHPISLIVPPAARDSLVLAGAAGSGIVLPIRHSVAIHGSAADSVLDPSNSYLADSVKAVRINVRVSNGLTGAEQKLRDVSTVVELPNNGLVQLKDCGTAPLLTGALTVTPNAVGNPPAVTLQWGASTAGPPQTLRLGAPSSRFQRVSLRRTSSSTTGCPPAPTTCTRSGPRTAPRPSQPD